MATQTDIYEINVFKDAMLDDNLMIQVDAVRRLSVLAVALGPEKTRDELFPVITDVIDVMNDEVLYNLAEQLEYFVPLVGGYNYAYTILPMLVKLSYIDETLVRERTTLTMKKICNGMTTEQCEESFYPIVEKMVTNDWFPSKCSAAPLFVIIYPKTTSEKQTEIRTFYRILIGDESPIVRRCAASNLPDFIDVLDDEYVKSEFVPIFDNLSKDEQDSVRSLAIDVGLAIANKVKSCIIECAILKTFLLMSADNSWKVRQRVAQRVDDIQYICGANLDLSDDIFTIFQNGIRDSEAEVRIAGSKNIFQFSYHLRNNMDDQQKFEIYFQEHIMSQVHYLITDENDDVRLGLSTNILSFSTILSNDCFNSNILPLVLDALENEESMPFKENMLKNLNSLPNCVDITKSLKSVNTVIKNLLKNSQLHWRTRRNVLIAFLHIAKNTDFDFFDENIKVFYVELLNDSVFAIRRTACAVLPIFIKLFGFEWAVNSAVPIIYFLSKSNRYLIRHIALFCIRELISPSLDVQVEDHEHHLDDLKLLEQPKILAKILELNSMLLKKLEKFQIGTPDVAPENLTTFAEDTLITLQACQDKRIFSIDHNEDYLENILIIFNRDLVGILEELLNDSIINIRQQAEFTVLQLGFFCEAIENERKQEWIQIIINDFSDEFWSTIREELSGKLQKAENVDLNLDLQVENAIEITETDERTGTPINNIVEEGDNNCINSPNNN